MKKQGTVLKSFGWFMFAFIIIGTAITSPEAKWLTIHNDFFQYDLNGDTIRTRSGCLCKFGETYYWYGCDKFMTNQTCYSSTDLLHWTNHGNMLTATRGTNRMDVLYNDSTKKYVMVLKWETPDGNIWCNRGIATSTSPTGPFTKLFDSTVYGKNTGDMSVFQDDDGKAYYCWEVWDKDLDRTTLQSFARMTGDYINLEKRIQDWSDGNREANLIMKRRGKYYYMTSGMMGIDPTETRYWTAPKIDGPWTTTLVSVIAPGDAARKSWDTQCDFVFPFKGTEDTVQMYCGDRWKRLSSARNGDYVWLPLAFTAKDSVILNYYQDWEIDPDRGVWRTIDSKRNLALNKPATASSVNGSNVAGNVTSASTWQNYMDTRWISAASDPQWITVDLGSAMTINRVILKWDSVCAKSFSIQVSTDNTAWTNVFSTTKNGARSVTDETFAATTARYVRMHGTQRTSTGGGYSLFDFMVLNDSIAPVKTVETAKPAAVPMVSLVCTGNTITFSLREASRAKIDIVDIRGKTITRLAEGHLSQGSHTAALPSTLGRGIYFLRLLAGKESASVKLVRE